MQQITLILITADLTTYTVRSTAPLKIGQLLLFLPSNTVAAVVSRVKDSDSYLVRGESRPSILDTSVTFYSWWKQQQPNSSARLVSVEFFAKSTAYHSATLKAEPLVLPTNYTSGSLGWDLWYKLDPTQPWLHVLKGNDLNEEGCFFRQSSAQWPIGFWLFKATLFYKTNLVPLARGQHYFETNSPVSTFDFKFNLT